jgi:GNAT superfamily N-acetyltransferase
LTIIGAIVPFLPLGSTIKPLGTCLWTANPNQRLLVALDNGRICGVAAAFSNGEITLNYVSPDARFRGVSKALLFALEEYLVGCDAAAGTLTSTQTAHRFYLSCVYKDDAPAKPWRGGNFVFSMRKALMG